MKAAAVIPAAGKSLRMGKAVDKALLEAGGKPLIRHSVEAFSRLPFIKKIVVAVRDDNRSAIEAALSGFGGLVEYAKGGAERQDSVYAALSRVEADIRYVAVHDAARPVLTEELLDKLFKQARRAGAVAPGVPPKDTVKMIARGRIEKTLKRADLFLVQTPQVFDRSLLLSAFENAISEGFYGTDEASLVERIGHPVRVIAGYYENIKVTTPEDIPIAELHLANLGSIRCLAGI